MMRFISISSRPLSFVKALGPPVEQGRGAHQVATGLQRYTAGGLDILELVDRAEMAVHQHRIGEGPPMLCGLELGRVDPLCQGN